MICNNDVVNKTVWFGVLLFMMFETLKYNVLDVNASSILCMTFFFSFPVQRKDLVRSNKQM